jgi:hypothetical protein
MKLSSAVEAALLLSMTVEVDHSKVANSTTTIV